jgi:hypothetical protein
MSEYGYIPEAPEQSFGNNKGIFTPKDIYDLTRADKYTNYGQLELIETQTTSSAVATVDFNSIKGNEYNVHLVTMSNSMTDTGSDEVVMRFKVGGTPVTSGYQRAQLLCRTSGTFLESRSTSYSSMRFSTYNTASGSGITKQNSYLYIYNAGDSSKYTFSTHHSTGGENVSGTIYYSATFGSNVLPTASVVNGIQFLELFGGNMTSNITFSLYGIRYS